VKQYKEESKNVMHKLARIANVVINVGKSCEKYNLSESDLPDGLRNILGSLRRSVRPMAVLFRDYQSDEPPESWTESNTY
jgi:hypothetical protein